MQHAGVLGDRTSAGLFSARRPPSARCPVPPAAAGPPATVERREAPAAAGRTPRSAELPPLEAGRSPRWRALLGSTLTSAQAGGAALLTGAQSTGWELLGSATALLRRKGASASSSEAQPSSGRAQLLEATAESLLQTGAAGGSSSPAAPSAAPAEAAPVTAAANAAALPTAPSSPASVARAEQQQQQQQRGTILPLPRRVLHGRESKRRRRSEEGEAALAPRLDHPALRVIRARQRQGSQPGARLDKHKVGLVVEGGGMRGVVSAGGLQALHDLGILDEFDAVYGSSAGAANLCYYLSRQREGVDIYTQDIATRRFVDLQRLWRSDAQGTPALDLGFLFGHVMRAVKPLDWQAVVDSRVPLKVAASCLDTLEPVILERFTSTEDLAACLRASANVPVVAGGPVEHRGGRYVDAAVFEAIPFRLAIADGCTHILTLCTRPPPKDGWLPALLDDALTAVVKAAVMTPGYMKAAWKREAELTRAFGMPAEAMLHLGLQPGAAQLPQFAGAHVYPCYPTGDAAGLISPVCINPELLDAGRLAGRAAVLSVLSPQAGWMAEAVPQGALSAAASHPRGAALRAQEPILASSS